MLKYNRSKEEQKGWEREMLLKSKVTSYGLVELRQEGGEYRLYVNGTLKKYSKDPDTMMREFDRA
jgi:hypothetical protein